MLIELAVAAAAGSEDVPADFALSDWSQTSSGRTSETSRRTVSQDMRLPSAWSTAVWRAVFSASSSGLIVDGLTGGGFGTAAICAWMEASSAWRFVTLLWLVT